MNLYWGHSVNSPKTPVETKNTYNVFFTSIMFAGVEIFWFQYSLLVITVLALKWPPPVKALCKDVYDLCNFKCAFQYGFQFFN